MEAPPGRLPSRTPCGHDFLGEPAQGQRDVEIAPGAAAVRVSPEPKTFWAMACKEGRPWKRLGATDAPGLCGHDFLGERTLGRRDVGTAPRTAAVKVSPEPKTFRAMACKDGGPWEPPPGGRRLGHPAGTTFWTIPCRNGWARCRAIAVAGPRFRERRPFGDDSSRPSGVGGITRPALSVSTTSASSRCPGRCPGHLMPGGDEPFSMPVFVQEPGRFPAHQKVRKKPPSLPFLKRCLDTTVGAGRHDFDTCFCLRARPLSGTSKRFEKSSGVSGSETIAQYN
jgi:hypothetical protein